MKFYSLILTAILLFLTTEAESQIKLPAIFADSMVLQRDMPLPIWGTAKKNATVTVLFKGTKASGKADRHGNWKITLPPSEAGGPFLLQVTDKESTIILKDLHVGEVWLCSGQSNMEWPLEQSEGVPEELKNADNSKIRFFRMTARDHLRPIADRVYSPESVALLKMADFYERGQWETSNSKSAAKFSAVGYYFGKALQNELQVPIGLILNAVGGTTTQSFISIDALQSHPQLKQFAGGDNNETWLHTAKEIHPWVLERTRENLQADWQHATKETLSPHPFGPSLLFDAGVRPLTPFAIKGVIWYQGESNATHPQIHDDLFTTLVKNWRSEWAQGDFPFYFVQLPGISNRTRWPEFRESQKRLSVNIPNVGMAVTIDVGDSLDVHPRDKKTVGRRLALLALAKTYQRPMEYSGPVLASYERRLNEFHLSFAHARTLLTSDGKEPKSFVLEGYDKGGTRNILLDAKKVRIAGNTLTIEIPEDMILTGVRYAWSLWPDANLINEAGLPASPFKIELPGNN
jgi:sialate O-acetylesterase